MKTPPNQKTILDYFYDWEAQKGDQAFLRQPMGSIWSDITWREAGDQARRMAAALQRLGLQKGDRVATFSKNCYHWIIADLAIMMGGFVSAPFYPNLTSKQLQKVLELSGARVLFVGKLDTWEEPAQGIPEHIETIAFPHYNGNARVEARHQWDELIQNSAPISGDPRPKLDDLWTIIYTSGTTGSPKGVMHHYAAPTALMENERTHNNLKVFSGTEHRYFSYLPLNHIAERIIVEVAAIMTGGTISFAESLDTFARNLQDTQPTLFMAVPRIWTKFQLGVLERLPQKRLSLLLSLPILSGIVRRKIQRGLGLSQARILLTGAAPTPDPLKAWYQKLGLKLQEVYAMTENCGGCTLMPISDIRPGTVGRPLPNVRLKINPENGEVLMKAPWVMQGYYQDPAKTDQVMRDGWLHTGDQGELTPDGFLKLTGRVSDTFKSAKGKYIVPAPIEWGFAENNYIEQVCVVGLALPQPLALVVLSELGLQADPEVVTRSLAQDLKEINEQLSSYEHLKAVVIVREPWGVDNGILTPTLKIRREALHHRYQAHYPEWFEKDQPVIWEQEPIVLAKATNPK